MGISDQFWKTWLTVGSLVESVRDECVRTPHTPKTRRLELSQLEERLFLSASPLMAVEGLQPAEQEDSITNPVGEETPTGDIAAVQAGSPENLHESNSLTGSSQLEQTLWRELVFIDGAVEDSDQLVRDLLSQQGVDREIEVILLDGERNGIEQIAEVLGQREELDAVHFVSHGNDHSVKLGNTWLDSQTLVENQALIESWSHALTTNADLLFYGCDLASSKAGVALLVDIQEATGADVAASTDDTGYALFGGNWDFEYTTGTI
ncbi:MAG: DUF4347 domain-containing protein, partial [Planctomycetaceae bacterium]|nr:DUF4347 domain-containing protein [Planctomycetaceae bacterium]